MQDSGNSVNKCAICGIDKPMEKHYYKTHNILARDYYVTYFPRYDLQTGELINFKSKDQYFSTDFNNKNNLKTYLKYLPTDEAQNYCKKLLITRKEKKNLQYAPSQVELRSLMSPSIIYYDSIFPQGYYKLCESLGFKVKHRKLESSIPDIINFNSSDIIHVDTREQNPFQLITPIKHIALNVGDYFCPTNKSNVYIERKSGKDFISTLGKGYDRFCRELNRARDNKVFVIVLVEEKLSNCLAFNKLPWLNKYTKINPDYLFHNVREICQAYPNVQFLFADGRRDAVRLLYKIFFSNIDFFSFDCQLALDMDLI